MISPTMQAYCPSDMWTYSSVLSGGFSMSFENSKMSLNYNNLIKNHVGFKITNAS